MRRSWTSQEDAVLEKRVKLYGTRNWTRVAEGIPNRSSKSCSERWRHFLDPSIKSPSQEAFNDLEAAIIVKAHEIYGNKWQAISVLLPERSCRAVKNFWHTNMGINAIARGAIMVSNPYLAKGDTLEQLVAIMRQKTAARTTSTASTAEPSQEDQDMPTVLPQSPHSVLPLELKPLDPNPSLPTLAPSVTTLLPMAASAPGPTLHNQFLQLLAQESRLLCQQLPLPATQPAQQPEPSLPCAGSSAAAASPNAAMNAAVQSAMQQLAAAAAPAVTPAPAVVPAAVAAAKAEQGAGAAAAQKVKSNLPAPALPARDNLCEQLLVGFSAATGQEPSHSNSDESVTCVHLPTAKVTPATNAARAGGNALAPAPLQLPGAAAGADLIEGLFDNLSTSEVQAMLADFWGEGAPPQMQWDEPWGVSAVPVAAVAAAAPAHGGGDDPQQDGGAAGRCSQCPCCQLEAIQIEQHKAAAAAAPATPTPLAAARAAGAPCARPPPLLLPPLLPALPCPFAASSSPAAASPGSPPGHALDSPAGSTSNPSHAASASGVQIARFGSVNSLSALDGALDVAQFSALLAAQQQRLAQQQQELQQQQQQLQALQVQLTLHAHGVQGANCTWPSFEAASKP